MKTKENIKKGVKNNEKNSIRNITNNIFYKTNPSGISLIVLVITIIVIIILAAAVILTLNNNNPINEANRARYESDVANMQAIFTNTVSKVMAQNQCTIEVNAGELNSVKVVENGVSSAEGRVNYTLTNPLDSSNENGVIVFNTGTNNATTYYTGRKLPLYSAGETIWYVDSDGVISLKINEQEYGNGNKTDNPAGEVDENKIVASDNPMLQSWDYNSKSDFHSDGYKSKITKIKFASADKLPENKVEAWDVSEAKDRSVMAWVEDDGNEGYILTIAGKEKIIANIDSSCLFYNFTSLKEIEKLELLDTSLVSKFTNMFKNCTNLTTIFNLRSPKMGSITTMDMFKNAAIVDSAKITLNYENTPFCKSMVDNFINNYPESNLVEGIPI